jgi:hypothetical protein
MSLSGHHVSHLAMTHPSKRSFVALACLLMGCASSSFNSTWANPTAAPVDLTGKRVLAVVHVREDGRRRASEDLLAAEITKRGGVGVASYTMFPSTAAEQDTAAAVARARQDGIDGVVLMRFTGTEQSVTVTKNAPPVWINDPYYRRPWGAWRRGWGTVYESETVRTDTKVLVETRVYSIAQERLLWAGTSETLNPSKSDDVIRSLAEAVSSQLKKAGILSASRTDSRDPAAR